MGDFNVHFALSSFHDISISIDKGNLRQLLSLLDLWAAFYNNCHYAFSNLSVLTELILSCLYLKLFVWTTPFHNIQYPFRNIIANFYVNNYLVPI